MLYTRAVKCPHCHTTNEGFRSLCKACGHVLQPGAHVVLRAPTSADDPRWDVRDDLVKFDERGDGLTAEVAPARSTRVLMTSGPVLDDAALELTASVTCEQLDKAAGFALDLRVQKRSLYRAEALLSGWYRINRVDDGKSTVLGRVKAPDLNLGESRVLRFEAAGDRLRLAVDGTLLLSLRDDRHRFGSARVVAVPGDNELIVVKWSGLTITAPA